MRAWWRRGPSRDDLAARAERAEREASRAKSALLAATSAFRHQVQPAPSTVLEWARLAGVTWAQSQVVVGARAVRPAVLVHQADRREDHPEWPLLYRWDCEGCGGSSIGLSPYRLNVADQARWHASTCVQLLTARDRWRPRGRYEFPLAA